VAGSGDITAKRYKVLMIAPTSFFADYGCHVRILEEARVLNRLGHQVVVCTYRNGQDVPGLEIRRTLSIPFRRHYEVGSSPHKIAFDMLLFWKVLATALRWRPDVIHGHLHEGALLGSAVGRLLGIPLVFDFQGSMTSEMIDHRFLAKDSVFYRPLYWLETRIDRAAPAVITSSRHAVNLLVTQFGCRPERVHTVADCVDAEAFYPVSEDERASLDQRRAALGIPAGRRVVVYLGLLAPYQGIDLLLRAVAELQQRSDNVHFLIMGYPAVEHYRSLAHQLGVADHTTFTGRVPYDQARSFLALGDVAVAPKLSDTEGSGKILNYMAMGLPTVAFDTPVSREYLGDEGIFAAQVDATSLAQGLMRGLEEAVDKDGQRPGNLRRIAVERFSWTQAAETIVHAYKSVCRNNHGGRLPLRADGVES
jgi:glycosyltransferase involved in cell wall biosynthesis